MFAWKMDAVMESAYGSKLENVPQGDFEAVVLSGYRTQESTGTGTDPFDAKIVEGFRGEKFLEIKVRPIGIGTGRMLPDPNSPELTPEQRTMIIGMHEWARSEFTVEGLDAALNCGDSVMCYYKKGNVSKSDFTGLRFRAPSLSPTDISLMLQEVAAQSAANLFSGQVSTMGALMIGNPPPPDGIVDNPGAYINSFKGAFNSKGYLWNESYNIVGVRSPGGVDTFNDFVFLCVRDADRWEEYKRLELEAVGIHSSIETERDAAADAFAEFTEFKTSEGDRFMEGIDDWEVRKFVATTKPGKSVLINPDKYNSRGTGAAILVPGQYLDTWVIGVHGKKLNDDGTVKKPGHPALKQTGGPVSIYRDNNKDDVHDYVGELTPSTNPTGGYNGINIHRAGSGVTTKVGNYSAGCQVFAGAKDHETFMGMLSGIHSKTWENNQWSHEAAKVTKFAYTLLLETDL